VPRFLIGCVRPAQSGLEAGSLVRDHAYFTTGRASNGGGTEAINGRLKHLRGFALGFRNLTNYRLRMILAAGRITHPNLR
jgi:hypothetical protein